ncbi:MAG: sulfotransferase domain-containing protein [Saprospiraceae bacterium]
MNNKIDLMIIGAQKAGTTSLNKYLSQHPKIITHNTQEFFMFADVEEFEKGFDHHFKTEVGKNDKKNKENAFFVGKRVGLIYNKELLLKLKEHNPEVKIVLVLRNPIERAFSAFRYCRQVGMEPYTSFEDAIFENDPNRFGENKNFKRNCDYLFRSMYNPHIETLYSLFKPENIRIFLFEEIILDLNKYLNEMVSMINLPGFDFNTKEKYNQTKKTRSTFVSGILSPGKFKIIRNLLPLQYRLKLKNSLRNLNMQEIENKKEKVLMKVGTRKFLLDNFKSDVLAVNKSTELPIQKYWPEFFN